MTQCLKLKVINEKPHRLRANSLLHGDQLPREVWEYDRGCYLKENSCHGDCDSFISYGAYSTRIAYIISMCPNYLLHGHSCHGNCEFMCEFFISYRAYATEPASICEKSSIHGD